MARHCSRTGCCESAASTLTYQYKLAQVWIDELAPERDPHAYDLCDRHTRRLTAPQGWQVRDRRSAGAAAPVAVEPIVSSWPAPDPVTSHGDWAVAV